MESLNSKPLALSSVAGPITRRRKQLLARAQGDTLEVEDTAATAAHKRLRRSDPGCAYDVCLYVRWYNIDGHTRVSRLPLEPIASVDGLRGLFRRLIRGAFAPNELPDYLTSHDFYKFTPREEFISLPGDTARTEFRLVVTVNGWEFTVAERELGVAPDPARNMLVTVAEFESDSFVVEDQEIILNLVSYPTVCVRRAFLDEAVARMLRETSLPQPLAPQPLENVEPPAPAPVSAPSPPRCHTVAC